MPDYNLLYKSFAWKNYEGELSWFPNHKLNAAYNAIDRNAKNFRKNKVALYYEGEKGEKEKAREGDEDELLSGSVKLQGSRTWLLPLMPSAKPPRSGSSPSNDEG